MSVPIAAICHAAQILATANVIQGKKCSAYPAVGPDVAQAGGTKADLGQGTTAGSHDGPAVNREAGEQVERSGEWNHAFQIFDFPAFDFAILGFVVRARQIFAHRSEARTTASSRDNFLRIEAVFNRPLMPDAGNGGGRVDQYSIHVKEERAAADLLHQCCDLIS